jgi:peroxiredoxin
MSLISTGPLPLGATVESFRLPEPLTGRWLGPEDFPEARALVVAFLSNQCPHVRHLADALADLARDLEPRGLQVLGVNPLEADDEPDEAPAEVAAEALRRGYIFPYLIDQTQRVAKAYGAVCTPDFYLFDARRSLVYHGRFDETRFGGGRPAHGGDLRRAALGALKAEPPAAHQVAAHGCRIRSRSSRLARPAQLQADVGAGA